MKSSIDSDSKSEERAHTSARFWFWFLFASAVLIFISIFPEYFGLVEYYDKIPVINLGTKSEETTLTQKPTYPPLDKIAYDKIMNQLANNPPTKIPLALKKGLWPVNTVYPDPGAILPFKRIVAFYGNMYSKSMGVLGEYPEDQMLSMLEDKVKEWEEADPNTPVIPALHYIAVTAQGSPGFDGKYRARMPDSQIKKVIDMAKKINAIVFLDVQVGYSNLQTELPLLEKYMKLPQVNLGIDPEFSMKNGISPGKVVGTFSASDINYATQFLAKIVDENNLPPKILIVHRYTEAMVTNYKDIKSLPEVQIVMDMDGWGPKPNKISTYQQFIYSEPVQFAGFKLFFKSDVLVPGSTLMTPQDILKLRPIPIYIQYQ